MGGGGQNRIDPESLCETGREKGNKQSGWMENVSKDLPFLAGNFCRSVPTKKN